MRKSILILSFFISISSLFSQENTSLFGIKGGLNFPSNNSFEADLETLKLSPSSSSGYHIGIFKQWGGESFFLRPEVVYTKSITSFEGNDLEISSIDIPINIGMRVLGPIYLTGGPLLQNLMDSSYSDLVLDEDSSKMRILANFGAGLSLGGTKIELRYERGLSEKEFVFLNKISSTPESKISNATQQFTLSLFLTLDKK